MKPIDAADVIIPPIKGPITPEGAIVWSEAIAGITTLLFPHLIPVPVLIGKAEVEAWLEERAQNKCDGIRTSWPWRGYPCGAVAKYELDGLRYCGAHFAEAVKAKSRYKVK